MMHGAHPIGKKCTIHELHAHKQKKSQERSRIRTFQGGSACMRFSPQFLRTAAPSKCYWIYTKECYITEQNEITETSVITRIS